jgi:hypothetical protein
MSILTTVVMTTVNIAEIPPAILLIIRRRKCKRSIEHVLLVSSNITRRSANWKACWHEGYPG